MVWHGEMLISAALGVTCKVQGSGQRECNNTAHEAQDASLAGFSLTLMSFSQRRAVGTVLKCT